MSHTILAQTTASVSELKRNEPAFYCVPTKVFEEMLERLEDIELNAIADARLDQPIVMVDPHAL